LNERWLKRALGAALNRDRTTGAVYFTKQNLDTANFADAIQLIQNDDRAYWCGSANGQNVKANDGSWFCAVGMPKYQGSEAKEGE